MSVRFRDAPPLPAFLAAELPFSRRIAEIDGRRIHFVDQGEGPVVLLFHGNPMWCFLWRKVIARLASRPIRIIAPDLLGFGFSDKPRLVRDHSLELHRASMSALVDALEIERFFVVGQDWGGPVAGAVALDHPEGFAGAVFANTAVIRPARPFRPKAFHRFSQMPIVSDLAFRGLGFPLPVLHRVQGEASSIGPLERRAYRYPLRDPRDRAGPLGLARMVPNAEDHASVALLDRIGDFLSCIAGPIELVWGTKDPILGRGLRRHQEAFPRARTTVTEAGHFLQEEVPDALVEALLRVMNA